jgi:hypothetical protein
MRMAFTSGVDLAVFLFLFVGRLLDRVIHFSKYYLYLDGDHSATIMAMEIIIIIIVALDSRFHYLGQESTK